jgi:hypothetical protein
MHPDRGWSWPSATRQRGRSTHSQFNAYVVNGRLHCSAGDYLIIVPMMAHMIEQHMNREVLALENESFMAAARVCANIQALRVAVTEDRIHLLRDSMRSYTRHRAAAYGTFVPKHHYNMHIAEQAQRDGLVYDMFLLERHHKSIKRMAENIKNLARYEYSLMSSVTTAHLSALAGPAEDLFPGLQGQIIPHPDSLGVNVARSVIDKNGMWLRTGDVVRLRSDRTVGKVAAALADGNDFGVWVEIFETLQEFEFSGRYGPTGAHEMWQTELLVTAAAWYSEGDVVIVLG